MRGWLAECKTIFSKAEWLVHPTGSPIDSASICRILFNFKVNGYPQKAVAHSLPPVALN